VNTIWLITVREFTERLRSRAFLVLDRLPVELGKGRSDRAEVPDPPGGLRGSEHRLIVGVVLQFEHHTVAVGVPHGDAGYGGGPAVGIGAVDLDAQDPSATGVSELRDPPCRDGAGPRR
jgi:hypothetical protein